MVERSTRPLSDAQVPRASRLTQLSIRASASGANVQVIIKEDDTLTVTYGGATTTFPTGPGLHDGAYPNQGAWMKSYGNPTILTVME